MRPLRYSINVTLDGCCHHEAGLPPDDESMGYWTASIERADALLFGRVPGRAAGEDGNLAARSSSSHRRHLKRSGNRAAGITRVPQNAGWVAPLTLADTRSAASRERARSTVRA